jgi:hypothetical protein
MMGAAQEMAGLTLIWSNKKKKKKKSNIHAERRLIST